MCVIRNLLPSSWMRWNTRECWSRWPSKQNLDSQFLKGLDTGIHTSGSWRRTHWLHRVRLSMKHTHDSFSLAVNCTIIGGKKTYRICRLWNELTNSAIGSASTQQCGSTTHFQQPNCANNCSKLVILTSPSACKSDITPPTFHADPPRTYRDKAQHPGLPYQSSGEAESYFPKYAPQFDVPILTCKTIESHTLHVLW